MKNKLDARFIWIFYIGLTLINTAAREYAGSNNILVSGLTFLFPVIVLQPLMTVLWTRLYVNRKGLKLYDPADLLYDPNGF
jgi:hypothetical protein